MNHALAALERVSFGALPDPAELAIMLSDPECRLVNLSGVEPEHIYAAVDGWQGAISSFVMADVFSRDADMRAYDLATLVPPTSEELLTAMGVENAEIFCMAVRTATRLIRRPTGRVHVYCHRGIGRSVAVTFASVAVLLGLSPLAAARVFLRRWPNTRLSPRMISAIELVNMGPAFSSALHFGNRA